MILTCPNCSTKYLVDPAALGVDGRRVRCARCRHIWLQEPEVRIADVPPVAPPPDQAERAVRPPNLPATFEQLRQRSLRVVAGWVVLAVVIVGLLTAGFLGRRHIVAFWPPAIELYDSLGIAVADDGGEAIFGEGLAVEDLWHDRVVEGDGEVLVIHGRLINRADVARPVPPLRVRLTDADGEIHHEWTFSVGRERLEPGESVGFDTSLRNPERTVTLLEISPAREG